MYEKKARQATFFEDATLFGGVMLNPENRWVRMSELIPWEVFEERYAALFSNPREGKPAKSARMAIGSLIIKKRYGFSDEDTVEEIRENPYLQYFLGFAEYTNARPFDPSVMTWFRERITPEMLSEVNDYVIGRKKVKAEKEPGSDDDNHDDADSEGGGPGNRGTLILDATCVPQNIRFPTDASLLNEGRELLEGMIDTAHKAGATEGNKPRTYRNLARRDWLRFARDRKATRKKIRKAIRQQLGYVKRNLGYLEAILSKYPDALSAKELERMAVIRMLYAQQQEMYDSNTHRVDDRIVSLHQPWVRPIVRGKAAVPVEFGAKVALSLSDGYARIEEISWDAFNESTTLMASMERYKEQTGHYPERGLVDRIYRTRENLTWCRERGIRLNGPKLGRPPKDRQVYEEALALERQESGERSHIEGCIGVCKRRYGLDLVMMRLKHTSEVDIHAAILTRNLFRRLRLYIWLFLAALFRRSESTKTDTPVPLACLCG
jgi:IS5 family transposase